MTLAASFVAPPCARQAALHAICPQAYSGSIGRTMQRGVRTQLLHRRRRRRCASAATFASLALEPAQAAGLVGGVFAAAAAIKTVLDTPSRPYVEGGVGTGAEVEIKCTIHISSE